MRLLAAALTGMTAALLTGWLTGAWPKPRRLRVVRADRGVWLTEAGLDLTPFTFWMTTIGCSVLAFLATWAVSGLLVVAAPAALMVMVLPRAWLMRRRARRVLEVQRAWPDGLRDLVASISSGASLPRSIETMARSGPPALRTAFARYPQLSRGLGVVPALEVIKAELAHPTSDRVIEVLIVAHERGGPIVLEILRDLAAATTRDTWVAEEIETLALEQKINARVVFVIPWMVLAFMTMRPGPFREFYASSAGAVVIVVGVLASALGMWVAGRLGREPDEPRVSGGSP
ncbi:MAG TPA: type II secretion system F family protein [Acidimicrobiia bacterium]|jgi:tight adherence protein B